MLGTDVSAGQRGWLPIGVPSLYPVAILLGTGVCPGQSMYLGVLHPMYPVKIGYAHTCTHVYAPQGIHIVFSN